MTATPNLNEASSVPSSSRATSQPEPSLQLTSIFRRSCIETIRPGTGKSSVISLLVQSLAREEHIDRQHAEKIISELLTRERHGSSAIGRGLAFPHLRTVDVDHFVGAIGIAPQGINFESVDGEPTRLVLLTLSPWEGREAHSSLLSRLVSLMNDKVVTLQLRHSQSPDDLYDYLTDLDGNNQPLD